MSDLVQHEPPVAGQLAGQLVGQLVDEHPVLAGLGEREQLLAAVWLSAYRSAHTRAGYARDYACWVQFLSERRVDVLGASRLLVDLFTRTQLDAGAAAATVRRRLSALGSFYGRLLDQDLVPANPVVGVRRPWVDPDHTTTVGLSREQARALLAAGDADPGPRRSRGAAVLRLLLLNGLRVAEVIGADVRDLGHDAGHRVLWVVRKGGRRGRVALAPATAAALDAYLAERAGAAGVAVGSLRGPLLATAGGQRLDQSALWQLVRRVARAAGIEHWDRLSPHSLRHTAITLALDAGINMRDVQDLAGHADPKTTRRYDRDRHNLDRHATYALADYVTEPA